MKKHIMSVTDIGDVVNEIQIVPIGEFEDSEGVKFKITPDEIANIVKTKGGQTNDIVLDYEHQTLDGVQAPAAGWIKTLVDKGTEGLWAIVEWTNRAKEYLQNKEYRYLSPVLLSVEVDENGYYRPNELHSVALTNTPQIDGMVPIVSKLNLQERDMGEEKIVEKVIEKIPESILELLGLQSDAGLKEVTARLLALKQKAEAVSLEEYEALKEKLLEKEVNEVVSVALKDGKIKAEKKDWAMKFAKKDLETFKLFIEEAPVVVQMSRVVDNHKPEEKLHTEAFERVCKLFGNDINKVKQLS